MNSGEFAQILEEELSGVRVLPDAGLASRDGCATILQRWSSAGAVRIVAPDQGERPRAERLNHDGTRLILGSKTGEVYLTYQNMPAVRMLTILMGLSLVKAALIIGYFMHMKYEVSRMKWLTMCSLIACLALMMIFFPDALRILSLGVK